MASELAENYDIIVVTPHPDDAEIGIGGIMARASDEGYKVLLVNLTDGEPTPLGNHETRMIEAKTAADILGIDRLTLNLVNRRVFDDFESRITLADIFRRFHPEIVITMGGRTVTANPDHGQCQMLAEAAVFYSRLTKWEKHFSYPPWTVKRFYYFPVATMREETPQNTFLIDISDQFDRKMESIRAYKSQFPDNERTRGFLYWIENTFRSLGGTIGVEAAEGLKSPRLLKIPLAKIFSL
ncbi:MAG: PIG-L deacetylase family protein [Candidatus Hodarchaeales archaeon]